ncbi:hypothetical protein [Rhodobacteraceae bacterium DSL-40]|uniref:hypothetical protein n=1 Tax=Amaricoccus sp. B4 TaxID=3368557 RepID=UPI0013A70C15
MKTTTAARTAIRDAMVRKARATAGKTCSTMLKLCLGLGNPASVRAARAFAKSIRSRQPQPHKWQLDRIIAALSNGACDVDESARRITRHLSSLLYDQDTLMALAQASRRPSS